MSDPAPRFQFSLADTIAAVVSLAFPMAWISALDLWDLGEPEWLAVAVVMGLLLGFFCAVQYRRAWNSQSAWFVPPFLLFFWSALLLPFSAYVQLWPAFGIFFYPPFFLGAAVGLYHSRKRRAFPILAGLSGAVVGAVLAGLFLPSLIRSRSAVNETAAEAAIKDLVYSQETYHRTDHDKDGLLEYAMTLKDMYETKAGAADLQIVDQHAVGADATTPSPNLVPKAGYYFRILRAQGSNAPGGAKSYCDEKGNLTLAFAIVAYPAVYRKTGRSTFITTSTGVIYQNDLGPQTKRIVEAMNAFDLDPSWYVSE